MTQRVFPRLQTVEAFLSGVRRNPLQDIEMDVKSIIESVRQEGETAVRRWSAKFDQKRASDQLFYGKTELDAAAEKLPVADRRRLQLICERVRGFAEAQKKCLTSLTFSVPGGRAGHSIEAVEHAGCYIPSGRYPLPSSVIMTVIPARVAGVACVWTATPNPDPMIMAAASIAGADGLLAAGGAQAIAALAFGVGPLPAADVIVGPGNRYVTAAKKLLAGEVRIDMLAGPSELVVIADGLSNPKLVAADLLAQAEHDELAVPILIALDGQLIADVEQELDRQLLDLPTAETARFALRNGGVFLANGLSEAAHISNTLAPEHLQVCIQDPEEIRPLLKHFGALFVGESSAEVFGDYGIGPNHVLPTGQSARSTGGLSVFDFLRIQTWMQLDNPDAAFDEMARESIWLARTEGLEAHARAVEYRIHDHGDGE